MARKKNVFFEVFRVAPEGGTAPPKGLGPTPGPAVKKIAPPPTRTAPRPVTPPASARASRPAIVRTAPRSSPGISKAPLINAKALSGVFSQLPKALTGTIELRREWLVGAGAATVFICLLTGVIANKIGHNSERSRLLAAAPVATNDLYPMAIGANYGVNVAPRKDAWSLRLIGGLSENVAQQLVDDLARSRYNAAKIREGGHHTIFVGCFAGKNDPGLKQMLTEFSAKNYKECRIAQFKP